jgi:photosystem II stability/assembly factor-like uncharacterized protein
MKQFLTALALGLLMQAPLASQSTWQTLPLSPSGVGRIDDVFFVDGNTGWCATSNARIYKTTNGGATWTLQFTAPNTNAYFRCIEFLDENVGYAGSLLKNLYKTTDGGLTWVDLAPSITPVPAAICGIDVVDEEVVYAVGQWDSPGFVLKSTDGGLTWVHKPMAPQANALVDVQFVSRDTGFVCGKSSSGATILYTTDGGQSWTQKFNSGISGEYVWKLQCVTPQVWVGSIQTFSSTGRMVKSTDGGQTWTALAAPLPDMQGIGFATPDHGWVGGYNAGFFETTDGGLTWELDNIGGNYNRFFFLDSTLAYAAGSRIYKFSDPNTAVETPDNDLLEREELAWQVAPNPAYDRVVVTFDLKNADRVRLSLLDAQGRELRELHRAHMVAGAHVLSFDLGGVASGTYLLAMQRNWGLDARVLQVQQH